MTRPSSIRRKAISTLALPLAKKMGKIELKKYKLVGPKQVFLPETGVTMNYYEREAQVEKGSSKNKTVTTVENEESQKTLLFCHGFTSSAHEFFSFLRFTDIPKNVRILIPEQIGHGEDLKRAMQEGESFQQPDADIMVESTSEFLDAVHAGPNTNALGTSLGGVLLYYLKIKRPDVIQKTVLVSPALAKCLADPFLNGLLDGTNNFTDFQSPDDVVHLFRNILWTDPEKRKADKKKKKDPLPKFAYDVVYEMNLKNAPRGHNKGLQDSLIRSVILRDGDSSGISDVKSDSFGGNDDNGEDKDIYLTTTDIDCDSHRIVVWPEEDQICDYQKGKRFFEKSVASGNTVFETIPECGHVFHDDGTGIYELVAPKVRNFLLDFSTLSGNGSDRGSRVVPIDERVLID